MKKIINLFVLAFVIVIDRLVKAWAFHALSLGPWSVCHGVDFVLSWNRGISWSMFATDGALGFWLLTAIIMATILLFAGYTVWRLQQRLPVICEMLVLGGAISNMIDRFWYGAVLDFIELYIGTWSWPVFNLADSFVVIGVFGILARSWLGRD